MNNAANLLEQLRINTAKIEQRIADLRQNKIADMRDMQRDVEALCQRIVKTDPESRPQLETEMTTMISRLDELEAELKLFHERKMAERDARWKS